MKKETKDKVIKGGIVASILAAVTGVGIYATKKRQGKKLEATKNEKQEKEKK